MTRLGRELLLRARPPGDRRRDERGHCAVCGQETRFAFNSWVLPRELVEDLEDSSLATAFARRESLFCRRCGSNLRVRRIAETLLGHYAESASSLAELVREPRFRELELAELNAVGALHPFLAAHPRLTYAEYPDEDFRGLSYANGSFDLLLTSDTLEHVPDPRRALDESRRVLRLGGRHVFTVPLVPSRPQTLVRARDEPGGAVHLVPPQHHGRGSGIFSLLTRKHDDLLAYTDFALDLLDELRGAGFDPEARFLREADPDSDLGIVISARAV